MAKLTSSEIVKRLGGPAVLADEFGVSEKAIEMWERRGDRIPGRWHIALLRLAKKRRVRLSIDELSTHSQRAA